MALEQQPVGTGRDDLFRPHPRVSSSRREALVVVAEKPGSDAGDASDRAVLARRSTAGCSLRAKRPAEFFSTAHGARYSGEHAAQEVLQAAKE